MLRGPTTRALPALQLSEWFTPPREQQQPPQPNSGPGAQRIPQASAAATTGSESSYKANVDALVAMLEKRYATLPILVGAINLYYCTLSLVNE